MPPLPRTRLAALCALALAAGLAHADKPLAKIKEKLKDKLPVPALKLYRVSRPAVHENLAVFFIFGEDQVKGKKILTLDEALKQKKVVVHETNTVNQLVVENVSEAEVFIQAGDIVKGGQQDRTIATDVLLKPMCGRVTISSFCVEKGRWAARGREDVTRFSRSHGVIVGNSLKIAARVGRNQDGVWREIGEAQKKLAVALKGRVKDPASETSLQLTLEHKNVQGAIEKYVQKLEAELPSPEAGNVIGYAAAINGRVVCADVYANSDLFRRLWPKLLRGSVIEAVSERGEKAKAGAPRREAVSLFLAAAAVGKMTERTVLRDLKEVQRETPKHVLFETRVGKDGVVLRRSYLAK
jgi:hypothetical protein